MSIPATLLFFLYDLLPKSFQETVFLPPRYCQKRLCPARIGQLETAGYFIGLTSAFWCPNSCYHVDEASLLDQFSF
jgi:hypothetical protein